MDQTEALIIQYKPMVRKKARGYFLPGADMEDLIQEGMIGLYKAIRDYRPEYGVSFEFFAELCTVRQIQSAVRSSLRETNKPLNSALSYDEVVSQPDGESYARNELLEDQTNINPEDLVMAKEEGDILFSSLEKELSSLEKKVLAAYRDHLDYQEVARALGITPKAADNALQRIRRKAKKYWNHPVKGEET